MVWILVTRQFVSYTFVAFEEFQSIHWKKPPSPILSISKVTSNFGRNKIKCEPLLHFWAFCNKAYKLTSLFCGVFQSCIFSGLFSIKAQMLIYPALMIVKFHNVMLKNWSSLVSCDMRLTPEKEDGWGDCALYLWDGSREKFTFWLGIQNPKF